jgi:alpha-beta hydrolase superfamily lysophospholipase
VKLASISNLVERLAASESKVPDLKFEVRKRVVWFNEPEEKTEISVIYVHGFSATSQELRPFPDDVASGLKANLFFTRLAGHGQDNKAMGKADLAQWVADIDEAIDIGRTLGNRIVVIACSTGAPLVLSGLKKKSTNVAACVFVSPNFGLAHPIQNFLLQLPKVRIWGPFVMGRSRGFEPRSLAHEKYWNQSYGIEAVYTMMEAVQAAAKLRIKSFTTPLALIYCSEDKVVSPKKILSFFKRWGGPKDILLMDKGDDSSGHLLIGDIMNPNQTKLATQFVLDFCLKHLRLN